MPATSAKSVVSYALSTTLTTPGYTFGAPHYHSVLWDYNVDGKLYIQAASVSALSSWGSLLGIPDAARQWAEIDIATGTYSIISATARGMAEYGFAHTFDFGPMGEFSETNGDRWLVFGAKYKVLYGTAVYASLQSTVAGTASSSGKAFGGEVFASAENGWFSWVETAAQPRNTRLVVANEVSGEERVALIGGTVGVSTTVGDFRRNAIDEATAFAELGNDGYDYYFSEILDVASDGVFSLVALHVEDASSRAKGALSYKSETALVNAKTGTIKVVEGQSGALDGDSTQTGTVKAMSMDAKLLAIQYRHGFGILERKTGVEVYVPFDKVFDDYDRSEYYWYAVHMTDDGGHIYVKVEGGDMAVVNVKKTLSRAVTETGTSGGETLTGSEKADVIFGLGGHDILKGLGGADELYGGRGNDKLIGGNGSDTLLGDVGDDILSGGGADDKLIGGSGADKIKGGFGSDMLLGGSGADILQGNAARDILNVGKDTQRDLIVLTKVSDSAKGRANRDQVRNFDPGEDKFDLRKIDAKIGVAGNQKLAFEGTTKSANSVWYSVKSGKVLVLGDVNGDAQADFEIDVLGVTSLQASDFIL